MHNEFRYLVAINCRFVFRSSWFMRTDDDVFVNVEHLLTFLSGIDARRHHFIGQAGRGRGEEEGKLSLLWNQNFCMGGTGMVLSRPTLKQFVPKIETCLSNLMTGHEDVEVGRCVTLATGQSCTWAYEMQNLFFHSAGGKDERGLEIQPDMLNPTVLNNAITIHPVKSPKNMEKISAIIRGRKRLHLLTERRKLEFELAVLNGNHPESYDNLADLPPISSDSTWDFIYGNTLYTVDGGREKGKVSVRYKTTISRIVAQVVDKINKDAREKGRSIEYRDLYYAYINYNPRYGNTYILDILLVYKKFQGKKMTVKVRRHVFVREILVSTHIKRLTTEMVSPSPVPAVVPGDTPNYYEDGRRPVTLLLTVAGDNKLAALERFLGDYEGEVLLKMNPVKLVVVAFKETNQDTGIVNLLKEKVSYLEKEFPGFAITVVEKQAKFSRAIGLTAGLNKCQDTDLVFIVDVDISFNGQALENVRRFTVEGRSVYYPIVFSEFRDGGGYWRDFGYGIMAGFKKDIIAAGGFNTAIQGWGKEDVDLYDKLMKSGIFAFRSTDANLIHKYHKVNKHLFDMDFST